eukprot:1150444-Pelagomonas_calceolata.AAC.5
MVCVSTPEDLPLFPAAAKAASAGVVVISVGREKVEPLFVNCRTGMSSFVISHSTAWHACAGMLVPCAWRACAGMSSFVVSHSTAWHACAGMSSFVVSHSTACISVCS